MIDTFFSYFLVLFVVLDPVGVAAIFVGLSHSCPIALQRQMAIRGTLLASGILVLFFLSGEWLLELLGIGVPAFRIAGGILLFLLAIDMVFARQSGLRSTTVKESNEAISKTDLSVFPLAFPLISGPGAMTTVLLVAPDAQNLTLNIVFITVLLSVLLIMLLCLLHAPTIARILGETGANVISRLLGLILASLAVQYIIDGLNAGLLLHIINQPPPTL